MPQSLTDLERGVLDYLVDYLRRNTYQPSIREIGREFHIRSTKTVSEVLQSLAVKGYIERDASRSRGVRVLGLAMSADTVSVPCYERSVDMGEDMPVRALELDRQLAGASGTFIVTMPDDAMRGDGFRRGDLLLVEPVDDGVVENGDIVLATRDGPPLLRRFVRRADRAVLETADGVATMAVEDLDDLHVAGRVIGIVRRLRAPHATHEASSTRTEMRSR